MKQLELKSTNNIKGMLVDETIDKNNTWIRVDSGNGIVVLEENEAIKLRDWLIEKYPQS